MANTTITPGKTNITTSPTAPTVRTPQAFAPAKANLALTPTAPVRTIGPSEGPGKATLLLRGSPPVLSMTSAPQPLAVQPPTGDIRYLQQLDFPGYAVTLDWLMTPQNLIEDGFDLQTAVIIALGTDALADVSDELPDPDATDRRGWWGDMDADVIWGGWPVGCKLWLMSRAGSLEWARDRGAAWRGSRPMCDAWSFVTDLIASQT
jgi:hypothetical protein